MYKMSAETLVLTEKNGDPGKARFTERALQMLESGDPVQIDFVSREGANVTYVSYYGVERALVANDALVAGMDPSISEQYTSNVRGYLLGDNKVKEEV